LVECLVGLHVMWVMQYCIISTDAYCEKMSWSCW
jgi:hypothetical protein